MRPGQWAEVSLSPETYPMIAVSLCTAPALMSHCRCSRMVSVWRQTLKYLMLRHPSFAN